MLTFMSPDKAQVSMKQYRSLHHTITVCVAWCVSIRNSYFVLDVKVYCITMLRITRACKSLSVGLAVVFDSLYPPVVTQVVLQCKITAELLLGEQVKLIREKFEAALGKEGARMVDINTIDGFQVQTASALAQMFIAYTFTDC